MIYLNPLFLERPRQVCVIEADMTKIRRAELEEMSVSGQRYKTYNYEIILDFGGPELKAQTCWMDKASLTFSPSTNTNLFIRELRDGKFDFNEVQSRKLTLTNCGIWQWSSRNYLRGRSLFE